MSNDLIKVPPVIQQLKEILGIKSVIERPLSYVLLSGVHAYKIKKSVRTQFINLKTPKLRKQNCEIEISLNKRYWHELYLDIISFGGKPLNIISNNFNSDITEYAIKMIEFPQFCILSNQINTKNINKELLFSFGKELGLIHLFSPIVKDKYHGQIKSLKYQINESLSVIKSFPMSFDESIDFARLERQIHQQLVGLHPLINMRKKMGFVREIHGDLTLDNIVFINGKFKLFDCLEFNQALRKLDVLYDLASLIVEIDRAGFYDYSISLIDGWVNICNNLFHSELLYLYKLQRCLIGHKVEKIMKFNTAQRVKQQIPYLKLAMNYIGKHQLADI